MVRNMVVGLIAAGAIVGCKPLFSRETPDYDGGIGDDIFDGNIGNGSDFDAQTNM